MEFRFKIATYNVEASYDNVFFLSKRIDVAWHDDFERAECEACEQYYNSLDWGDICNCLKEDELSYNCELVMIEEA